MFWQLKIGKWHTDGELLKNRTLFKNRSCAMQEMFRKVKEMKADGIPLIQMVKDIDGHTMWQTWDYKDGDIFIELRPLVKVKRRKKSTVGTQYTKNYFSKIISFMVGADYWR